jgi:hypothetical protein
LHLPRDRGIERERDYLLLVFFFQGWATVLKKKKWKTKRKRREKSLFLLQTVREKRELENFELLVPFLLLHLWKKMKRKRDERAPAKQKTKREEKPREFLERI